MNRGKTIIAMGVLLILQTVILIFTGMSKEYLHMDEAYSFGLASYERAEIQENEDFYNQWHDKDYYEDYLAVQEDEVGEYGQVYENQKNDSHPPFYYLLLRFAMGFTVGHFSMWPGLVLNLVVSAFITIVTYMIVKKLLRNEPYVREKSLVLSFLSSMTLAGITNSIYIRMYALLALMILITTLLHMKLLEEDRVKGRLMLGIGAAALLGSLTHYYYLIFLAALYVLCTIYFLRRKKYRSFAVYTVTLVAAAVVSLILYPNAIHHLFFGYRGQGVLSSLSNIPGFITNIGLYLHKVNTYGFHHLLYVIVGGMIAVFVYRKIRRKTPSVLPSQNREMYLAISVPTGVYFLFVAVASPYVELRYMMPVCGLLFILVFAALHRLLKTVLSEKKRNIALALCLCAVFSVPFLGKMEPEVLYRGTNEVIQKLEHEVNVPTVYFFNSRQNRFLDDILLFSKIQDSYVAKDVEITQANVQGIFSQKDSSGGVVVFINEGQNHDRIIKTVKDAMGFHNSSSLAKLNACQVYYIR